VLVVVALGGNALLRRGEPLDAQTQRANAKVAAEALARLAEHHQVVVTHGNGPQVGLLALQTAADPTTDPYPLDVLDAETEGMIGYVLEQELGHHLPPERIATLLTQIVVAPDDPAFGRPTKPIGPVLTEAAAEAAARTRGWSIAPDGAAWRRVVASPEPLRIVELETIRLLVAHGVTVICAGGGGIPVVADRAGGLHGVEAVIDKDLAAALLATSLGADALLLLTDVDGVYRDWGGGAPALVRRASVAELRSLDLPAGSMGPKVEAICRFVDGGGALGGIGSLGAAEDVLRGLAGTTTGQTPT
jgi:carbamate kinase